jgi:hypothetical protein
MVMATLGAIAADQAFELLANCPLVETTRHSRLKVGCI